MIRWVRRHGRRLAEWFAKASAWRPPWADRRIKVTFTVQEPVKLRPNRLYVASTAKGPSFGYLLCPCGCGETLHLRFLPHRRPRWDLDVGADGVVSLRPSVWRQVGCRSHFILTGGKVFWC